MSRSIFAGVCVCAGDGGDGEGRQGVVGRKRESDGGRRDEALHLSSAHSKCSKQPWHHMRGRRRGGRAHRTFPAACWVEAGRVTLEWQHAVTCEVKKRTMPWGRVDPLRGHRSSQHHTQQHQANTIRRGREGARLAPQLDRARTRRGSGKAGNHGGSRRGTCCLPPRRRQCRSSYPPGLGPGQP